MTTTYLKLRSNDGDVYTVPKTVAELSDLVKNMVDIMDGEDDGDREEEGTDLDVSLLSLSAKPGNDKTKEIEIPLQNVAGKELARVVEYCTMEADHLALCAEAKKKNEPEDRLARIKDEFEQRVEGFINSLYDESQRLYETAVKEREQEMERRRQRANGEGGGESPAEEEVLETPKKNQSVFALMLAVNYLNIPSLLDVLCRSVAYRLIRGKSVEEMRDAFGIENTMTKEEEELIRRENAWAFND